MIKLQCKHAGQKNALHANTIVSEFNGLFYSTLIGSFVCCKSVNQINAKIFNISNKQNDYQLLQIFEFIPSDRNFNIHYLISLMKNEINKVILID